MIDGLPPLLPHGTPAERLGAVVKHMLGQSRSGLPELTRDSRPELDLLGLRDYAALMKGPKSVSVYLDDHTIDITPDHNGGSRRGLTPIPHAQRTIADDAPAELLGTGVIAALGKAT